MGGEEGLALSHPLDETLRSAFTSMLAQLDEHHGRGAAERGHRRRNQLWRRDDGSWAEC